MRSKRSFIHLLSLVLCVVLAAGWLPTAARAESIAGVDFQLNSSPLVSYVWANGNPLVIEESGVYIDADRDGTLDEGETRVCELRNLLCIYGGTKNSDLTLSQEALITMNGGAVSDIFAGNYDGGTLTGNVKIIINDGTVKEIQAAGAGTLNGNVTLTVTGGDVGLIQKSDSPALGTTSITILEPDGCDINDTTVEAINNLLVREANGNWIVKGNVTIPADSTLTIPAGYSLTIPTGATLTNEGTISNNGDFFNHGTFNKSTGTIVCNSHTYNSEWTCMLCGYTCEHDSRNPASCTLPETCAECGKAFGEKLDHNLKVTNNEDASEPTMVETCTRCDHTVYATMKLSGLYATYTGQPIEPAYIEYDDNWLSEKNLQIEYRDNMDAGDAYADFGGSSLRFTIEPKPLTDPEISVSLSPNSGVYNGQPHSSTVVVNHADQVLTPDTDYTLSAWPEDMTNAGEKTATVSGIGNYKGEVTVKYTINKADPPAVTFPTAENEITYGQMLSEVTLSTYENDHGTFNWNAPTSVPNAGTASYAVDFIPNDLNNYDYTKDSRWIAERNALCETVSITVNKAEVPVPTIANKVYSGALQTADVPQSDLYTVTTNDGGTDVGEYEVILTLTDPDNYCWPNSSLDQELTFAITRATNEGDIHISGWTYGEDPDAPVCSVKFGEALIHYTGTAVDGTFWDSDVVPTLPGNYTVSLTVAETANYAGVSEEVEFSIAKAPITITATDASKTYGESDPTLTGTITAGQIVEGDTFDFTCSRNSGENAGTYTITATAKEDNDPYYDVTFEEGTFTIEKASLTVTAENKTAVYGDAAPTYTVTGSGFITDESFSDLDGQLAFDCGYTQYGDTGTYSITPRGYTSDNYEITFTPGTLTVGQKEIGIQWSEGTLVYNGNAQAPIATATGTVNSDALTLTVTGAKTDAGTGYEASVTEIKGEKAGNYKLPAEVTKAFAIDNADQNAPKVTAVHETISKKSDGKITGLTSAMEYRKDGHSTYTKATAAEVSGLKAGKYFVRYAAKANYNASADTEVVIHPGRKLTVTLPADQDGYTVTASATEFDWHDSITITYLTADGYSRHESFSLKVNGEDTGLLKDGTRVISFVEQDLVVTVEGVFDVTAPTATITLKDNWNKLWTGITFGRFFNETQTFTITAEDNGSGLDKIYYYLSETEIQDVQSITEWTEYTKAVDVDPERVFVIYAKATDKAGNAVYVNSDGFVLDTTAPAITGIENGKDYYGDTKFSANDANFSGVTVDGKSVTLKDGAYTIKADNREHTIVATDKAGNATTFKIKVYQIHTVTFVADGKVIATVQVNHGADVTLPTVPAKVGYSAKWNKDGKNILTDTTITAIYKALPNPNSPQTGDNSNIFLWTGMMLISALAMAVLAYKFIFTYKPRHQDL